MALGTGPVTITINSSWLPTTVNDRSTDVKILLNTLFIDHVVIYHDLLCKKEKILSSDEASKYIETCFPSSWLNSNEPIYKAVPPSKLFTWYEAKDVTSYVEIRLPKSKLEWTCAIKEITGYYAYLGYVDLSGTTVTTYTPPITYTVAPSANKYTYMSSVPSTINGPITVYGQQTTTYTANTK